MIKPTDLTVVKSDGQAELLAIAIAIAANTMPTDAFGRGTDSVRRSLRKLAGELLDLHDLKADEVLPAPVDPSVSAFTPTNDYGNEG